MKGQHNLVMTETGSGVDEQTALAYAIRWFEFEKATPELAETFRALDTLMADKSLLPRLRRALLLNWLKRSMEQVLNEYRRWSPDKYEAFREQAREHFAALGVGAIIRQALGW